jgi:hypothetical protein
MFDGLHQILASVHHKWRKLEIFGVNWSVHSDGLGNVPKSRTNHIAAFWDRKWGKVVLYGACELLAKVTSRGYYRAND